MTLPTRLQDLVRGAFVTPVPDRFGAAFDVIDADIAPAGLRVCRTALQGDAGRAWSKSVFGDDNVTVPVEPVAVPACAATDPSLLACLCAIAGPLAAAHPEWTHEAVADEAMQLAQACERRLRPAVTVTRGTEIHVGPNATVAGLSEAMREMLAREFDATAILAPGAT